jgi:uncharacterized protein (DUF486 family)
MPGTSTAKVESNESAPDPIDIDAGWGISWFENWTCAETDRLQKTTANSAVLPNLKTVKMVTSFYGICLGRSVRLFLSWLVFAGDP